MPDNPQLKISIKLLVVSY